MEAWKEIALSLPRVRCKSDIATLMPSRALALACLACFWEFNMRNFEETMDDSLLVTLTTTIYYSISPSNVDDRELIHLTKVTGSYTSPYAAGDYMGNGVYCVGSEVRLGQIGFRLSGGSITNQVKNYDMGTKRSWSITPPSNWESIVVGDQEAVGCRYQVILSRGSSEWIAELSNNH